MYQKVKMLTYSKLKLVPQGSAPPDRQARASKCYRHTCGLHETHADIAAHAYVDITHAGEFRYTIKAREDELVPLITASYVMLGELLEQLAKQR